MYKKIFTVIFIIFFNLLFYPQQNSLAQDQAIIVNIKRHVYHKTTCGIAKRCKKACIQTTLARALTIYQARPCKMCYKKHKSKTKKKKT